MRKLINSIVTIVFGLALVVALAAPAQASWSWVLGGYAGMASDIDGNGNRLSDNGPIGACQSVPWNDVISSVINRTSVNITFWWGAGCNGTAATYGPGTVTNDIGWWNNDEFSSYCIGTYNHTVPEATNSCHRWEHLP